LNIPTWIAPLTSNAWLTLVAGVALAYLALRLFRLAVTLPGLALTPGASRLLSRLVRSRDFDEQEFLSADGADDKWVAHRRAALGRLAERLNERGPRSAAWGERVRDTMSDLRFADANRVPFQFGRVMRERFNLASVAERTDGPYLVDLDGNRSLDVSGSYGVNVAGYDRYKGWLDRGWERVRDLGPVLGPLHPIVADNIDRLRQISGQDEVSFHVSGTEAVMAAVRLARFNTGRDKIVCFSGAYHGWWDGVQPGLGSERPIGDCLTLKEMNPASLKVLRRRAKDIAGVLINPVQSFHPNSPPPNDAVLMNSSMRKTSGVTTDYARWLTALRELCTELDIPLIFDEVYSGFRLAPGGAQEYYGVNADMVLYGKTLAAGVPIGVVCGRKELMRRFDPAHPMRIAYVVGTFSAYPLAMGAMNEFLQWVTSTEAAAEYTRANELCSAWVEESNRAFAEDDLPIELVNLGTIWTVQFRAPSRYNWLLQYYLRAEDINLSWVGTGRCLSSLDYSEDDYDTLTSKLRSAATMMKEDKWWLTEEEQADQEKRIKSRLNKDLAGSIIRLPRPLQAFYGEVMRRKHDDHVASHSDRTNQFLHLVSSTVFILCYFLIFENLVMAMWLGLGSLFIRQMGHALIEPPCHDKEQLLLGYDTRSKTVVLSLYLLIPIVNCIAAPEVSWATANAIIASVAKQWFIFTAIVIFGRVILLIRKHGFFNAMVWFVKLITDPITDVIAYYPSALPNRRAA